MQEGSCGDAHDDDIRERPLAQKGEPKVGVAPAARADAAVEGEVEQQQLEVRPHEGEGEDEEGGQTARMRRGPIRRGRPLLCRWAGE